MIQKIIGAALILAACGGMGLSFAAAHRQKERMLQQLIAAAKLMMCELQYRHTALPQLMSLAARESGGSISRVFATVRQELERQIAPDAACCAAGTGTADCAGRSLLGNSLGRFDLQGQLSGLETVAQLCQRDLDGLQYNRQARLRSYMTLSLCAGAVLVILFI